MKPATRAALFGLWALLFSNGCGSDVTYNPPAPSNDPAGNQSQSSILIRDETGKSWDVTHALNYDMVPSGFYFGRGPFTIAPIMNPQMLFPGDQDYPSDDDNATVLGVNLNGFARAYPLTVMRQHEVANEQFGDAHVAVAY